MLVGESFQNTKQTENQQPTLSEFLNIDITQINFGFVYPGQILEENL